MATKTDFRSRLWSTGVRWSAPTLVLLGLSGLPANAATTGRWSPVLDWPRIAIHAMIMPDGQVMTYGTGINDGQGAVSYDLWNPKRGTGPDSHLLLPSLITMDSFCAAQVLQPWNGIAMTAGGNSSTGSATYDGRTLKTSLITSTQYPRWYATMTTMPDGRIVIQGGMVPYDFNTHSTTPEIYTPGQGWSTLTGAASVPAYGQVAADGQANYVHSWPVSATKLFTIAGQKTFYLNVSGQGSISNIQSFNRPNWGASGTAVMYRPGKILQVGGGAFANNVTDADGTKAASIIDITGPSPVVTDTGWMAYGRHWLTATVLPTGEVLVTGGALGDNVDRGVAYAAEIWNPNSGGWRTDASMQVMRLYHSTAILLPDARILSAGGGAGGPIVGRNAEIFTPGYLLDANGNPAPRPTITSAPGLLTLGQSFPIGVTSTNGVSRVTLIKTGAVTHGWNNDQRFIELTFRASGNTLSVDAPANAVTATPGYYMLFVLDKNGVPSEAKILKVPVPAGDDGIAPGSRPSVSWTAPVVSSVRGSPWSATCNDGEALGGFYGTTNTDLGGVNLGSVGARCVPVSGGRWTANLRSVAQAGNATANGASNTAFTQDCPRDQVVSAVAGRVADGVRQIALTCSPLSTGNGAAAGGTPLAAVGGTDGTAVPAGACPQNGVGYGLYGTSLGTVARLFGVLCRNGDGSTAVASSGSSTSSSGSATSGSSTSSGGTTASGSTATAAGSSVPAQPTTTITFESASNPGFYARRLIGDAMSAAQTNNAIDKLESSFRFVPGLGGQGVSIQSIRESNRYLSNQNGALYHLDQGAIASKASASFTRRSALASSCGCSSGACVSYESVSTPNAFIHVRADASLSIDGAQTTAAFQQQASFCERAALSAGDSTGLLKVSLSKLCLSVASGGGDGAPVTQQSCTGAAEQNWTFKLSGDNYTIVNQASGKCLTVSGASTAVSAPIVQSTCAYTPNQTWTMKAQNGGALYVALNSNMCMDIATGQTQPGLAAIQWPCNGGPTETYLSQ